MFNALAPNSVMVNYGRLAKEHLAGVDVGQLYFANKTIRGFWLNKYLRDIGVVGIHALKQKVVDNW